MPREFPRSRRIEEQIQRILSDVLRVRVRDPRLHDVVITGVDVSRDLCVAKIYFTALDPAAQPETLTDAIDKAAGFIRSQLARELTVRHVPELRFRFDTSLRDGEAMEHLIDDAVEQDRKAREGQSDERES